jgi:hypothetical protein
LARLGILAVLAFVAALFTFFSAASASATGTSTTPTTAASGCDIHAYESIRPHALRNCDESPGAQSIEHSSDGRPAGIAALGASRSGFAVAAKCEVGAMVVDSALAVGEVD